MNHKQKNEIIKYEKPKKEPRKKEKDIKWMVTIIALSFALTFFIGLLTERVSDALPLFVAFVMLILIITLGIVFDIFGVAVNVANVKQFHAMAANRVAEARYAVFLCRHSEKVSSICNDVIGDICGIISGAIGSGIILRSSALFHRLDFILFSAIFTAFISSLTIGGKAYGKRIATQSSENITLKMGKFFYFLQDKLRIPILGDHR